MRIGIISDIHSNYEALKEILPELTSEADEIYCTGDIIGYGPSPNKCIKLIEKNNVKCVSGNHDSAVLKPSQTSWFNRTASKAVNWTREKISEENKQFLENIPIKRTKENSYFVHGSPTNELHEYLHPEKTSDYKIKNLFRHLPENIEIISVGHTHIPGKKQTNGKMLINSGSIGQPRDGNKKSSYGILDTDSKEFEIKRQKYDIEKTVSKIKKSKLPNSLGERLYQGK